MVSNEVMVAEVVGFVSPIVLAVIQQVPWTDTVKAIVTFLWSVVLGAITSYFAGAFNGTSIVTDILLILVTAIATYKGFWKKQLWVQALHVKTSYRPKTGPLV